MEHQTKNKKPSKIEEMTKEEIRQTIIKKRECTAKAQSIVESLLENCVTEKYFLNCLTDINRSHFEDVIEERAIIHLCGYPLCNKTLCEKDIPKQKYRISMKTNKVYDITSRKSFCSNPCYKSAMYIKNQMLISPLWFRDYEDISTFTLLPLDSDSGGSMGEEIELSLVEKISNGKVSNNTSKADETPDKDSKLRSKQEIKDVNNVRIPPHDSDKTVTKNDIKTTEVNNSEVERQDKEEHQNKKPKTNHLNIVGDIIERPEKPIEPISEKVKHKKACKQKHTPKNVPSAAILTDVEKCLAEWFTLDTLIFLFGENKVKEMVSDKGDHIKKYLNDCHNSIFYNSNSYDQYQQICKRLNLLELEDKKNDAKTLQRESKPLPDYSILKEESKNIQLKVKAFISGKTEIDLTESEMKTDSTENDSNLTQLPLVDKNAQNALRRRIVCQHLNKVLPDLLRSLNLLSLSISSDVRLLVNTFKLKANNIMFKPIQWILITIVVIKLLSIRDTRLKCLLDQQIAFAHLQLLLLSYKQDGCYLDRLILWLTDVDRLLDTNVTKLPVDSSSIEDCTTKV